MIAYNVVARAMTSVKQSNAGNWKQHVAPPLAAPTSTRFATQILDDTLVVKRDEWVIAEVFYYGSARLPVIVIFPGLAVGDSVGHPRLFRFAVGGDVP